MKIFRLSRFALFAADILVLIICIGGFYLITLKVDLPFKTISKVSNLFITEDSKFQNSTYAGAELLSIDQRQFKHWEEVEFYLDGKRIGESVEIQLSKNGIVTQLNIHLKNYYQLYELIIIGFVSLIFFVMGVFVRIKAPENISANLFHWANLGLGVVIVVTAGYYNVKPFGFGHINRIIWLFAYSMTPVLFIHFTSSFTQKKPVSIKIIIKIFYVCAIIFPIILSYFFLKGSLGNDFKSIKDYVLCFNSFFRLFVIACIVVAITSCIYVYRLTNDRDERKRLQWLLLGFFIGPFSFAFFWILPILTLGYSLISESLILIFLIAMPITFAIAIVKYQFMDVNLIIRRSVVYTIILSAIILTYVMLASFITIFVKDINAAIPSMLTAVAVVVLLQPVRNSVQKFVDKRFFRVEYDYRQEQKRFLNDIRDSFDINTLANKIVVQTDSLIPVDKIGFFILDKPDNRIRIVANKGWDLLKGRSIKFDEEKLKTDLSMPVAVDMKVESGLNIESADIKVFKRWGMVLVFPVKSPIGIIYAFLALGSKKSGTRFYKDDIDLLNTVSSAAALAIERIKLQEELILEQVEAQRLEELNKMKSEFMRTMTHELKTPLSSIKMFTELMQNQPNLSSEKTDEYLNIINGESETLRRLIDNILDYAKIEKGMKMYDLKPVEIIEIIKKAVYSVQYRVMMKKQILEKRIFAEKISVKADADAVERALMNLLTNAVKYSPVNTKINVNFERLEDFVKVSVQDEGKGIPEEEFDKIFQPFYRSEKESSLKAEGTGLGLAIVKHIMDAHNGRVEVESEVGKGSTFTLWFPVIKDE